MKEKHLDDAVRITGEIRSIEACRIEIEKRTWTIASPIADQSMFAPPPPAQGFASDPQTLFAMNLASQALAGDENTMVSIAKTGLLAHIDKEIQKRRDRLGELGIEFEKEKAA